MRKMYYYNDNEDEHGYHEIHAEDCSYLPEERNLVKIGVAADCTSAIINARIRYPGIKFDGCYYCCRACHKG